MICGKCEQWQTNVYEVFLDASESFDATAASTPQTLCSTCVVGRTVPVFRTAEKKWQFGRIVGIAANGLFQFSFVGEEGAQDLHLESEPFVEYLAHHRKRTWHTLEHGASEGKPLADAIPFAADPLAQRSHDEVDNWWNQGRTVELSVTNGSNVPGSIRFLRGPPSPVRHSGLNSDGMYPLLNQGRNPANSNAVAAYDHSKSKGERPWAGSEIRSPNKKATPRLWTADEDGLLLRAMVQSSSSIRWPDIASKVPSRTSKQCRERYVNHLVPTIKHTGWTTTEDALLCRMYGKFGSKWSVISRVLPGRSDNSVKNRFHYLKRSLEKTKTNVVAKNPPTVRSSSARSGVAAAGKNDELLPIVSELLVHVIETKSSALRRTKEDRSTFGPFDIPKGDAMCARCGLLVPSSHTGPKVCRKTGWCSACCETSVFLRDGLLRLEHSLRTLATSSKRVSLDHEG